MALSSSEKAMEYQTCLDTDIEYRQKGFILCRRRLAHENLLHEYEEGKDELEGQEEVVRRLYQMRWVWSDTVVTRKVHPYHVDEAKYVFSPCRPRPQWRHLHPQDAPGNRKNAWKTG